MAAMKEYAEAQRSRLSQILDELELYDFECVAGSLSNAVPFHQLREIGAEMDAFLDAAGPAAPTPEVQPIKGLTQKESDDFMEVLEPSNGVVIMPAYMTTVIEGVVIGWADCARCNKRVRVCVCPDGPREPAYLSKPPFVTKPSAIEAMAETPTAVPVRENAKSGLPTGLLSVSSGPQCSRCGKEVTPDTADERDDGGWDCFECQEAS